MEKNLGRSHALLLALIVTSSCADNANQSLPSGGCNVAPIGTVASLSAAEVESILSRATVEAEARGLPITAAVVDHEGNVLGVYRMDKANPNITIGDPNRRANEGLDGVMLAGAAAQAAISKAGTAAYLSTQGHAFSSRTASFIVQQHFPPGVQFSEGGPLFGVQFSQLPCSDTLRRLTGTTDETTRNTPNRMPLGLAGDPGGVPLYKNGVAVGGVGIEGDGFYSLDPDPADNDQPAEEGIAVAAAFDFMAPRCIWASEVIAGGIRFAFLNITSSGGGTPPPLATRGGAIVPVDGFFAGTILAGFPTRFTPATFGTAPGQVSIRYPVVAGTILTAADVQLILTHAIEQAYRTRAAIRLPIGDPAHVNVSVVDVDGRILGLFRTTDAPPFGFDVSIQKARTALLLSSPGAADAITTALATDGIADPGRYRRDAAGDGIALDGSVAISARALGYLARPFFPDGIDDRPNGPFSRPLARWSVFNNGLQSDLIFHRLTQGGSTCTGVTQLANGAQIFPGGVPLYKDGKLAGGIGTSGDGVDQDDYITAAGAVGYTTLPPGTQRSDDLIVRGTRLPYQKFPPNPDR